MSASDLKLARLVFVALAALGCSSTRPCKQGTVLLTFELDSTSAMADSLHVSVQIDGGPPKMGTRPHTHGTNSGTIEVQFDVYPQGKTVTVTVDALVGDRVVGTGQRPVTLTSACGTVTVRVGAATDGGVPDEGDGSGGTGVGGSGVGGGGASGMGVGGGGMGVGGASGTGGGGASGTGGGGASGTGGGGASGTGGGGAGGSGASGTGGGGASGTGGGGASGTGGGGASGTGGSGTGGGGASGTGGGGASGTGGGGTGGGGASGTGGGGSGVGGVGGGPPPDLIYQVTGTWPQRKAALATKPGTLVYKKITVNTRFLAESCAISDYNRDGKPDISSGRRWYEGPAFTTAHIFRGGHDDLPALGAGPEITTGVSDDWADYALDIDGDGWTDIVNIASPDADTTIALAPAPQTHASAYWYKNPGPIFAGDPAWKPNLMHSDVRLEQHGLADMNGDGKPEILGACKDCSPAETKGYYQQTDWTSPAGAWTFRSVTTMYTFPFGGTGWLHGLGSGDVNGDGRPDLLERGGVWLQQAGGTWNQTVCTGANIPAGCGWIKTPLYSGATDGTGNLGGAQMFAADFDGDGDMDIFSVDWAHGWGMAWYEQTPGYTFVRHQFLGTNSAADLAAYGALTFSEPHALEVVDMDGDGVPDIVTGKRHFAYPLSYGDADPNGTPYVVVFKAVRDTSGKSGAMHFEAHQVDAASGVGTQMAVGHLDNDGILDFCVATKLGLFAFIGQ